MPRGAVPPPEAATELPSALALPDVALIDEHGAPFRTADLAGQYSLLFFGFTYCPDVCPLSMQVLAQALDRLEESNIRTLPTVVLISVDPARDTPDRLTRYLDNFDPAFIGATASDRELEPLLRTLGVTVMKHAMPGDGYNMTHNPQVFVLGPDADVIAIMSKADDPEAVVRDFLRIRQRHARGLLGSVAPR